MYTFSLKWNPRRGNILMRTFCVVESRLLLLNCNLKDIAVILGHAGLMGWIAAMKKSCNKKLNWGWGGRKKFCRSIHNKLWHSLSFDLCTNKLFPLFPKYCLIFHFPVKNEVYNMAGNEQLYEYCLISPFGYGWGEHWLSFIQVILEIKLDLNSHWEQ